MNKTLVIAQRDYLASVKTKSFLVSLFLMPVLMFGGLVVGKLAKNVGDTRPKKVAVIDRTAGADQADLGGRPLYQVLIEAARTRNESLKKPGTDEYRQSPYLIEPVTVAPDATPEQLDTARYDLSERVRKGDLFAFIEIGPKIVAAPPGEGLKEAVEQLGGVGAATRAAADAETAEDDNGAAANDPFASVQLSPEQRKFVDDRGIRYSSENTTNLDLRSWLGRTLTPVILGRRMKAANLPQDQIMNLIVPPSVMDRALAIESKDGGITYADDPNPIISFVVPIFMLFLMFTVIMTAAQPLTTNVIEEKQLRIAEVLLGSVKPFELMLGKLLGTVGVSLTLAAIYAAGGMFLAGQFNVLDKIDPSTIAWFLLFAGLGTLMYGALFVAVGAAVTNLKEAQNLLTPVILLVVAPMFVFVNVLQNPQGPLAKAFTYFPLTTPMTAVLRLGIPPGMPLGEKVAAAALALATTLALIWLAGRVFRFGMLHTDKAAAMRDMVRWVARG